MSTCFVDVFGVILAEYRNGSFFNGLCLVVFDALEMSRYMLLIMFYPSKNI
ncbi:hypothetical protein MGSAQ_002483 [marine sediment metagenome]|uniref:Uncharacterized protein n=1 Tax=marine sediment metagenome TaxID=412755 RepID=A0A1B6NSW4_9ZZZZ